MIVCFLGLTTYRSHKPRWLKLLDNRRFTIFLYSYFEKGCRKNVHTKGNMGYDQYTVQFSQISLKNSELKTTQNTFRDCRVHFFRQPFSKYLYIVRICRWPFLYNCEGIQCWCQMWIQIQKLAKKGDFLVEAAWTSGQRVRLVIRRSRVPVQLWPLAGFAVVSPEFKSSATLVNICCQLRFLILLCSIWIIDQNYLSGVTVN